MTSYKLDLNQVHDGACGGNDVDYQIDKTTVFACFDYYDPESGDPECEWALGKQIHPE